MQPCPAAPFFPACLSVARHGQRTIMSLAGNIKAQWPGREIQHWKCPCLYNVRALWLLFGDARQQHPAGSRIPLLPMREPAFRNAIALP